MSTPARILSFLAVALAVPSAPAAAGDEVVPIALDAVVDGAIEYTTEVDRYGFTAAPGQTVFVDELSTDNAFSLNWRLEDAYGRVLADLGNFLDLGSFTLVGGDYTIVVEADENEVASYSFVVRASVIDEATVALGVETSGELEAPGDIDRWTYLSTPGERVSLDFRGGSVGNGTGWRLVDAFGRELLAPSFQLADAGPFTLSGGPVQLEVRGVDGNDAFGTYDFAFLSVPDGTDANVALGASIDDAIDVWGEVDRYTFDAAPGERLSLEVVSTTAQNKLNLVLRDGFGRPVLGPTGSLVDQDPAPLMGGTYTLEIFAETGASGAYSIDLLEVPDDTLQTVAIGDTLLGGIEVYGQTEVWRFTATPGQLISLDVAGVVSALNWELVDELGRALFSKTTLLKDVERIALEGGDYELRVTAEKGTGDAYEAVLQDVVDVDATTTLDALVSGDLVSLGQRDSYTFVAPPGQVVVLDQISTSNPFGFQLNWILVDAVGREVVPRTNTLADVGPLTLMGGEYTVTILPEDGVTADYEVSVVGQGVDLSYTPPAPTHVLGETIDATLSAEGATDVYAFDTAGEDVYLDVTDGTNALRWTVRDPVGQPLFTDVAMGNANSADAGPLPLVSGTYTIEVTGTGAGTPDYGIRLVEVVDGGSPITLDAPVADTLATSGAVNRHHLSLATDTRVFVDLLDGDSSLDWTMLDAAGQPVFGPTIASSASSHDQGPFTLGAGEYVVEFDGDDDEVDAYEFAIRTLEETTQSITVGTPVVDAIDIPGDTKTFLLDVTDGQRLLFDNQDGATALTWELVDPVGQPVFAATGTGNTNATDEGPFALAAGQYTLTYDVTNSNTYSLGFEVWETADVEEPLTLEVDVTDTSSVPQQVFTYDFSLPSDTSLFFDGQFGVNDMLWSLVDEAGQLVFGPAEFHTGNSDQGPFPLFAGDYELRVEPRWLVDGTFGFSVHEVVDDTTALPIDAEVVASIPGPGASRFYEFTAAESQRVMFEVTENSSDVLWTLTDAVGEVRGFFEEASASNPGNHDQGPFVLAAGDYTLTLTGEDEAVPTYGFRARNVDQDLRPRSVELSPPVLFADETSRQTDVTWTVENLGGPDDLFGSWTDRVVLSNDDSLGDADDVVLGEFVVDGPVASLDTYERTETLTIPDEVGLGDYRVFVVVDALDEIEEAGGEDDNTLDTGLSVVPQTNGDNGCIDFDQLDGAEFPAGTTIALSGRASAIDGTANVVYVLDVSTSTQFVCGFDSNFDGVLDENDDLNGDAGASPQPSECDFGTILDSELGGTLLLDDYLGQTSDLSHAVVVFSDHGETGDLGPEQGKQVWTQYGRDQDGDGEPDFETSLRSAYAVGFFACALGSGLNEFTKVNVGCGTDYRAAHLATLEALLAANPAGKNIVVFMSDGLAVPLTAIPTPDEVAALGALGVDFRGYQLGGEEITESMQYMADSIDAQPGATGTARSVLDLDDLLFELVQSVAVQAVTVNGIDADSLDATGRFFHTVEILPGPNVFLVEALDADGQACFATITLNGVLPDDGAFEDLSVVTTSLETDWLDTTLNQFDDTFVVSAKAMNTGDTLVRGPLLMVIDGPTDPTVTVANPDGYTPDGRPYFTFLDTTVDAELQPGALTPTRTLRFANPNQVGVDFDVEWLSLGNAAPFVTSVPPLEAVADEPYVYDVEVADPDGHAPTYQLVAAPAGMTIDAATGVIDWLPTLDDVGSHGVTVAAEDGWGGRAEQAYTLVVSPLGTNEPPTFTSAPTTSVSTGAPYTYTAAADDPDDDPLVFELLSGPAGMVASTDGVVSWSFATPGSHPVALRVSDPSGASAEQGFTLTVGATSTGPLPPTLFGAPGATAAVDALYLYAPGSDSSAPVTFTLPTAPAGMSVDVDTGRVTWTPGDADVGPHAVTLLADNGSGTASQSWTVEVFDEPVDLAPVITSSPELLAFVDEPWSYDANAIDPEGAPLSWELVSGPAGMTIDEDSGLVQWTPTTAPDAVLVAVRALDVAGGAGNQVFTLPVFETNTPPVFTSTPGATVTVGTTYLYDAAVDDAEDHAPQFTLLAGPAGATVNPLTGVVSWTPELGDVGAAAFTLGAADGFGGEAEQSWGVDVLEDTTPPDVSLFVSANPGTAFEALQICVQASDDAALDMRMLTIDGVETSLDEAGCAFFTPQMPGAVTLVGTATDASGNVGSDSLELPVGPSAEVPLVELISPPAGSVVTKPEEIVASITDDDREGLVWSVDVRRIGEDVGEAVVIGSGTGEVVDDVVALFDPTVLPNDTYIVRIVANDGFDVAGVEYAYELSGALKPAQFSISFDDLLTTLAGIPIVITRNYSSLDRSPGDFGPGWRLGFYGDVTDSAAESDSDQPLVQLLGDEPFGQGERVYVTRPDGTRVGFTFTGTQLGFPTPILWQARFEADPGVDDTLEAIDPELASSLTNLGGQFFAFAIPYNPELYRFTTKDGTSYVLHEKDGLQSIETAEGNVITVTPDGLFAASGEAIVFERNADGYITRIVEPPVPNDPDGPADLEYLYDGAGDLVASVDQNGNATTYSYDQPGLDHYLTEILDPLGRPLVRSVYDDDGKLLAYCNGDADIDTLDGCVQFDTDVIALQQSVTTAKGRRIDALFDERGNVVKEIRFLDDGGTAQICRTFDDDDNTLTETDPAGNTTTFTYDENGNVTSRTDPAGRTWTFVYNDCDEIALMCDPLGNCTQSHYDDDCNKIAEVMPDGSARHWTYDDLGRQTTFTDATGNTWVAAYFDDTGEREVTDPDLPLGDVAFTQYGPSQRVDYRIDRDGRRIDFEYDDTHQATREIWDDGTVIEYVYDAAGQIEQIIAPDSVLSMEHAATGAVTRVDTTGTPGAPGVVLDYAYDAHVLVTSVADSLGGITTYEYDDLDRLASVRQQTASSAATGRGRGGSGPGTGLAGSSLGSGVDSPQLGTGPLERRVDLGYDTADLVRSMHRYADLAGTQLVSETFLDYDCGGCEDTTTQIHHRRADGSVIHDIDIIRDAAGNIVEVTDAEGLHVYVHDGRGRILTADHAAGVQPDETYVYDGEGNRLDSHLDSTSPVYSYQEGLGGSRLLADDTYTYDHDGEGRVVLRTDTSTGETTSYAWDHRGRLVEVVLRDAGGVEVDRASYGYDALDRRIRTTESGVTTHTVYDGPNPILVLDDAGQLLERRMYTRRIDGLLADEVDGTTRWYHRDQVGNVRDLVDDSGAILGHFVYDSFGNVISAPSDPAGDTSLRFQSRWVSPLTGLADFRARWYDARTGRFASLDPVVPLQYIGFENAPHRLTDPRGLTAAIQYACLAVAAYNNAVAFTNLTIKVWKYWTPKALAGLTGGPENVPPGFPDIPKPLKFLIKGFCSVTGSNAFPGAK